MPKEIWPDAIKQAYFDAFDTTGIMPDTIKEEHIDGFAAHWGGLSVDAFQQALQNGNVEERLFALFALSYLAPPDGEILLTSFLNSPIRKERWASAISLGKHKNEHVFSVLLELLVEGLEYRLPSLTTGEIPDDPLLKKAWEKELDHKDAKYVGEYEWCLHHRLEITLLLGSWGDPRAIPVLIQTFQQSLELELRSTYPNNFYIFSQEWHQFQDRLAYVLGQLGAWHALDTLDLPPKRLHIAHRYLVFGFLHASVPWVFDNLFLGNWGGEGNDISFLLVRTGADLTLGLPDLASVNQVLQERFAPIPGESIPSFHDFLQWHDERDDEWHNRWDAGGSRTNKLR